MTLEKFLIKGGRALEGEVFISGAKNSALPLMAASLLCPGKHKIENVPSLRDVHTMAELMRSFGAEVEIVDGICEIDTTGIKTLRADYELVKKMRASVLVLGPMTARYKRAEVSMPGGCAIGARPINLHLEALRRMGADIVLEKGYVKTFTSGLRGATIYFDIPTVTGTENIMMAAALAEGTTRIENAAKEPEVVDLAEALTEMGAQIEGAGTDVIVVHGVKELRPMNHRVIPDRIETGTYITAVAITGGRAVLKNTRPEHLEAVIEKMREAGVEINIKGQDIYVKGPSRPLSSDVRTMPYPGFPTDMQAQFMALMSIARGTSIIRESIFENRFMHVAELRRLGADITVEGSTATVRGVERLTGAPVMATDLRASASLVIAGLVAEGQTIVDRIYHLDRGYERMEEKLNALGAEVYRVR